MERAARSDLKARRGGGAGLGMRRDGAARAGAAAGRAQQRRQSDGHVQRKLRVVPLLKHLHCNIDICDKTFRTIRTYLGLQISGPQDTKYGLF